MIRPCGVDRSPEKNMGVAEPRTQGGVGVYPAKINTRGFLELDACARFWHSGQLEVKIVQTECLRMRDAFLRLHLLRFYSCYPAASRAECLKTASTTPLNSILGLTLTFDYDPSLTPEFK